MRNALNTKQILLSSDERECVKCREFWPADGEFFRCGESLCCRACEKENIQSRPLGSILTMPREMLERQVSNCRAARIAASKVEL